MEIRSLRTEDIEPLVEIWFKGSLMAHNFIDHKYWESMKIEMKNKYLPMSKTYVISQGTKILGFVSMVDNYLAALFIDVTQHKKGYGKQLLEFIKRQHEAIQLKVYQKNTTAIEFYLRNGFEIIEEVMDNQTSQKEFIMMWKNNGTNKQGALER